MKARVGIWIGSLVITLLFIGCSSSGVSKDKFDQVSSDLSQAQTDLENSQKTVASLEAQVSSLKADLDKLEAELNTTKDALASTQSQMASLEAVCPPGDFATVTELEAWVRANIQPETQYADEAFRAAVKAQQAALRDGYVVSIDIDGPDENDQYMVWCTAFVANTLYFWSPETTTVNQRDYFVK